MRGLLRIALPLLLSLAVIGCAKPAAEVDPTPVPAPVPAPPPELKAEELFPAVDWQILFTVTDQGKAPVTVVEELIRQDNLLVATYNGSPYLTWILSAEGAWRLDPKGGGALLRYLPGILKAESWKQSSGDAEVWFTLKEKTPCDLLKPKRCWSLTVLNRGERTAFEFLEGLGPYQVTADDYRLPGNSFTKQINEHQAGSLTTAERTAYLNQVSGTGVRPAPVTVVSSDEFATAEAALTTGSTTSGNY